MAVKPLGEMVATLTAFLTVGSSRDSQVTATSGSVLLSLEAEIFESLGGKRLKVISFRYAEAAYLHRGIGVGRLASGVAVV